MEEVVGSIPTRSTNHCIEQQLADGSQILFLK